MEGVFTAYNPLRSLVPVFSSQPPNSSSFLTPQAGAPFICVSPSGPFPPGFEQNSQSPSGVPFSLNNPISAADPLNSFRRPSPSTAGIIASPHTVVANGDTGSSRWSTRNRVQSHSLQHIGFTEEDDYSQNQVLDALRQGDGSKELAAYTSMIFDILRRRISQFEEANQSTPAVTRRPDLKAGTILMNKGIRANSKKRIGAVRGVEVGDIFFFRMELCLVGLHAPSMGGIDYMSIRITQRKSH
ncbi:Histone-lysine N-methyltransferase, H3 lysine-9 specific SUVH1 [Quillaja saponaria]|uniref:Histone-lysine N-methyltransferase, H3 lysine-9 specific SUVH1 n=1 Tax=Quillaja saponaria TaxID=32244 RepID=A0AAD7PZH4_QUISA|nr:Histone-lysine N-methyltransferase, H3 lysine-9 specific SUVH1 [Quillaja saponaria]